MLAKLVNRHTSDAICQALLDERILIRNCSNFEGLSNYFIRISLKNKETNLMLMPGLSGIRVQRSGLKTTQPSLIKGIPYSSFSQCLFTQWVMSGATGLNQYSIQFQTVVAFEP
jgi:hypothetical protein